MANSWPSLRYASKVLVSRVSELELFCLPSCSVPGGQPSMYTPEIESTILEVPRHTTLHTIFESSEIGQVSADERVKCKVMHVLNH
jgi:hypothetical protein